jgi:hypothetical protein
MTFDLKTGELSGTPTQSGVYTFKVRVNATNQPTMEHAYTFAIIGANEVWPPHSTVDIVSYPLDSGSTTGIGLYTNGVNATVTATATSGYKFAYWTDNGTIVSSNATYQFAMDLNYSHVANFISLPQLSIGAGPGNTLVITWPTNFAGFALQRNPDLNPANWVTSPDPVTVVGTNNQVNLSPTGGSGFFRLLKP